MSDLKSKAQRESAWKDARPATTCEKCRWARWPKVWCAQTGHCARARKDYITRDTPVCEMVSPALTTVRQDGAARARIAMEKLQALREGRTVGGEVILPVTLVVRGSTRIRK